LNTDRQEYTAEDIRYTTHNGALYAIALGWPAGGELRLHTLYRGNPYLGDEICSVRLLGSSSDLSSTLEDDGLHIKLPQTKPDEPAFTFRLLTRSASKEACTVK
jgi:alpha-L-fucosidase